MSSTAPFEVINARIDEALAAGVVPWHKPWRGAANAPRNFPSGRRYNGINPFLLALTAASKGYGDPRWITPKKALELGGTIRGEKTVPVVFWKRMEHAVTDPITGIPTINPRTGQPEVKPFYFLRFYNVLNVEQVGGVDFPALPGLDGTAPDPVEAAEAILDGMPNAPTLRHVAGDRAFYEPKADRITLPKRQQFLTAAGFYQTAFHEHTHSTGHKSRLDREGVEAFDHFGSERYAREELVAEFGTAYLMAEAGLDMDENIPDLAAYINNWRSAIKADPKALVVAAGRGEKAAEYILGRSQAIELEAAA